MRDCEKGDVGAAAHGHKIGSRLLPTLGKNQRTKGRERHGLGRGKKREKEERKEREKERTKKEKKGKKKERRGGCSPAPKPAHERVSEKKWS